MRRGAVALVVIAAAAAGALFWLDRTPAPAALPVTVAGGGRVLGVATATPVGPGLAVTVAHVVADGGLVRVAGRRARVLRTSARLDVALLAVPGLSARVAPIAPAPSDGAPLTLRVVRDGHATSLDAHLRRTVVARVRAAPGEPPATVRPALELAATVAPGDSGAPVADEDGRLVGIVFARSSRHPRTAWAVAATALSQLLVAR